jgi:hypothetical protein
MVVHLILSVIVSISSWRLCSSVNCDANLVGIQTSSDRACESGHVHWYPVGYELSDCHGWTTPNNKGEIQESSAKNLTCNADGTFQFLHYESTSNCSTVSVLKVFTQGICQVGDNVFLYDTPYAISCCLNPSTCISGTPSVSITGGLVYKNGEACTATVPAADGECFCSSCSLPCDSQVLKRLPPGIELMMCGEPTSGALRGGDGFLGLSGPGLGGESTCAAMCAFSSCADASAGAPNRDSFNSCFHEDTIINYKGNEYMLSDLLAGAEPECYVPHTPRGRGVTISTSCGRAVTTTETHLIVTSTGHQLARSLQPGDQLFGDFTGDKKCVVTGVTRPVAAARFFGLNCVHSEVLANGLRASTFGDFHALPAWYMAYAGRILGPEMASHIGDTIAGAFSEYYYA